MTHITNVLIPETALCQAPAGESAITAKQAVTDFNACGPKPAEICGDCWDLSHKAWHIAGAILQMMDPGGRSGFSVN